MLVSFLSAAALLFGALWMMLAQLTTHRDAMYASAKWTFGASNFTGPDGASLNEVLAAHLNGALSILKGFKPKELVDIAAKASLHSPKVTRRFPFRLVLEAKPSDK